VEAHHLDFVDNAATHRMQDLLERVEGKSVSVVDVLLVHLICKQNDVVLVAKRQNLHQNQ
jgi:hypothetical protein